MLLQSLLLKKVRLDGVLESERMPHSETLVELEIFDDIRRQGGYILPKGLEKIEPVA